MWDKLDFAITYASKISSLQVEEARRDATRRKISAVSGYIEAPVGSNEVYFESSVERDFLLACRLDKQIISVTAQPFTLSFTVNDTREKMTYTPDFLIEKDLTRQPGQFCIGAPDELYSLFEVKREVDLEKQGYDAILRIASGYCWAKNQDSGAFSVLTDTELQGDFGTYMRLLSSLVAEPFNETTAALMTYYDKHTNCTVGDVLDNLSGLGHSTNDLNNGLWSLIAKSILQPVQLGDIHRGDKLTFVPPLNHKQQSTLS